MPMKTKEEQRAYSKQHYQENKAAYKARDKARKNKIRKWVRDYQTGKGCAQCGEKHPACLQFHHKDPSKKEFLIPDMISNRLGIDRIQKEIDKCEILCANCHTRLHWNLNRKNSNE